jgi:hypothetical protein
MWFLSNKVLFTKDNLVKRKWTGCQKCCFCNKNETVDHLFLHCPFAKIIWRMIYFTYNIPPPSNVTNMFGNWLNEVKKLIRIIFKSIFRQYVGLSGLAGMILLLTNRREQFFCRLFSVQRIEYSYGGICFRRINGILWILGETGCSRSLRIAISRLLDDDILAEFKMDSFVYFSSFAG